MPKQKRFTAKMLITLVEAQGFVFTRQSGSHKIFKNVQDVRVTVPVHDAKVLHPKIVKQVLKDIGLEK